MKTPPMPLPEALMRRFEPLIETERKLRERKVITIGLLLSAATLMVMAWLAVQFHWPTGLVWFGSAAFLMILLVIAALIARSRPVDLRALARRIENEHPELQAALLTALDQRPGTDGYGYLQQRVVVETVQHSMAHDWQGRTVWWRTLFWTTGVGVSAVLWIIAVLAARTFMKPDVKSANPATAAAQKPAEPPPVPTITVAVKPGDTEVERGTRLIVESKFTGGTPTNVELILSDDAEGKIERARVPMKATVEANAFGGLLQRVEADGFYRVAYAEGTSKTFKVATYVHPALVRSDATITPPAYSGQPVKEVKNTVSVTALEGSQVAFRMKVNKPVTQAELYGEDKRSIPLKPSKDDPLTLEGAMQPEVSQKYRLHLVDAQDRANKQPPWITVRLLADQAPKVEIVFPKRDLAVSPIQEMPLEAKVWDDLGVHRSGAVFMLGDETREVALSDAKLAGKEHHALKTLLELEGMKAKPRQLVSYYVWAEDVNPKGETRRSQSDMFFAEVRHFEDIFREGEPPSGEPGEQNAIGDIAKLQKQVVNADWKLVRDVSGGKKFDQVRGDMGVVKESQDVVITQTKEALEKVEDAETRAALTDAGKAMQRASEVLDIGLKRQDAKALTEALGPEREALEALYRATSREHQVSRSQKSKSMSASEQDQQQQLLQLELKQKDKRYEEEKAAGDEQQTAEQKENLQVLNRLKELARRQEALAEKIKEVEQQMAQAKTEEERNELAQQLKRLQEEQEQLLRDLDELKDRMEQPENQDRMQQEREKLEAAREQVRQAAEQLAQQEPGSAANAATRAQQGIDEVKEEFRQRTAKRFAEEMKQLKQDASGLAAEQEKLSQAVAQNQEGGEKPRGSELEQKLEEAKTGRQVEEQRQRLEKVMEQMRQLSEQAEQSEPLLSTALNDTARRAASDGIDRALEDAGDQLRFGSRPEAQNAERKAAQGIEQLQKGVAKAAESVLGSETESLRMARNELDRLLNEVNRDGQQQPGQEGDPKQPKIAANANDQGGAASSPPAMDSTGQPTGKVPGFPSPDGKEPAQGTKPGEQGQGQAPGEGKEKSLAENTPGKGEGQGQPQPGDKPGQMPGEGKGQGQAQSPGGGKGQEPSPSQQAGMQPGKGQGQGQQGEQPGQTPGQGSGQGPEGSQPSPQMAGNNPSGQGEEDKGQQPGQSGQPGSDPSSRGQAQGQGQGKGQSPGQTAQGNNGNGNRNPGGRRAGGNTGSSGGGGDNDGGADGGDWFFNDAGEVAQNDSPITGNNFDGWTDRLRRVEEALPSPELRNQAARVLDNAREMRADWRRNDAPPQSDTVQMTIVSPLVELRNRVTEELARRDSSNPLAPLDRDPVPTKYRDQVRRYYTELGGGK